MTHTKNETGVNRQGSLWPQEPGHVLTWTLLGYLRGLATPHTQPSLAGESSPEANKVLSLDP